MMDALITYGHIVTLCWTLSRFWVPREAWTPFRLDAVVGVLAVATWLANTLDLLVHSGEAASSLSSTSAMDWFVAIMVLGALYVGLTYVSIRIRVRVGE